MQYWHDLFPGVIHDVHYEDLIEDQEKASRDLLAHCGLEWDPACLDFAGNASPVADRQRGTGPTANLSRRTGSLAAL